jgi:hypothetical protein
MLRHWVDQLRDIHSCQRRDIANDPSSSSANGKLESPKHEDALSAGAMVGLVSASGPGFNAIAIGTATASADVSTGSSTARASVGISTAIARDAFASTLPESLSMPKVSVSWVTVTVGDSFRSVP